jgi:hypothetical protein
MPEERAIVANPCHLAHPVLEKSHFIESRCGACVLGFGLRSTVCGVEALRIGAIPCLQSLRAQRI